MKIIITNRCVIIAIIIHAPRHQHLRCLHFIHKQYICMQYTCVVITSFISSRSRKFVRGKGALENLHTQSARNIKIFYAYKMCAEIMLTSVAQQGIQQLLRRWNDLQFLLSGVLGQFFCRVCCIMLIIYQAMNHNLYLLFCELLTKVHNEGGTPKLL